MITLSDSICNRFAGVRYIDLCCGGGGFTAALEACGATCVFAADIDPKCRRMYAENFGYVPAGDLRTVRTSDVPAHDLVCCGLPCQPFSINGTQRGIQDPRGRIFRQVHRLIAAGKPTAVLLENVPRLAANNEGLTFATIRQCLRELGYDVWHEFLRASEFGCSQLRRRLYLVALRRDLGIGRFLFPEPTFEVVRLRDHLLPASETNQCVLELAGRKLWWQKQDLAEATLPPRYTPLRIALIDEGGQGKRIYHIDGPACTMCASRRDSANTGLYWVNKKVRTLAPREVARCFGLRDEFRLHHDGAIAIRQLGNSVAVNVVQQIAMAMVEQGVFA